MQIAKTKRVPAGELKVGDVLLIPRCPSIDAGGEPYGGASVVLQTIVSIEPYGENGGLEFKTKWRREYGMSGDSVYRFQESEFVNKL